jgi:RNase P subunit RPR2
MIAQLEKHYKAIVCARCGAAIPVSPKIARLQEERREDTAATPRTFMARCRGCENEGVYTIDSIRSFEGEPTKRKSRSSA